MGYKTVIAFRLISITKIMKKGRNAIKECDFS
jgi:hypothetical protein